MKNEGSNSKKYFIYSKKEKNNSSILLIYDNKEDEKSSEFIIQNYINLYNYCSRIFEFKNGKLKYTTSSSSFDVSI